ncbi:rhodanese-like domain-containing protein [Colwellia echini]|uniref:Rhodanese-like domain-containing protein n=1 Tax=Colwellia echini TaxID=1982103 RepID=A0ABY3MX55_9GAMM|nr:rhodanese-like domain-containing protein [Colwellia echini]TYK65785.1 rhodanese-like domain-containing protein [Colwellia echini]
MNQVEFYKAKLDFEIDSWDLSEALNNNKNIIVVDARSSEVFQSEHIPTAINIPHRIMNVETTSALDKSKLYVTYCDGIGCNASTKGAMKLAELGFNVKELLGGLDWWLRDGYQTEGDNGREGTAVTCGC